MLAGRNMFYVDNLYEIKDPPEILTSKRDSARVLHITEDGIVFTKGQLEIPGGGGSDPINTVIPALTGIAGGLLGTFFGRKRALPPTPPAGYGPVGDGVPSMQLNDDPGVENVPFEGRRADDGVYELSIPDNYTRLVLSPEVLAHLFFAGGLLIGAVASDGSKPNGRVTLTPQGPGPSELLLPPGQSQAYSLNHVDACSSGSRTPILLANGQTGTVPYASFCTDQFRWNNVTVDEATFGPPDPITHISPQLTRKATRTQTISIVPNYVTVDPEPDPLDPWAPIVTTSNQTWLSNTS